MAAGRVEEAYRHHHLRLWRALYAFSGDRDVASDAESEAFTQALRRGDAVDDVGAWVWRTSFKVASGMLAGRHRTRSEAYETAQDCPAEVADLLDLLRGLSDQQRACVVLRYVGGFTAPEIATHLRTTPATVRVQLHRAHQHIRSMLDAMEASE